jgi:hypothetical protein
VLLFSHIFRFPSDHLPSGFSTKILYAFIMFPMRTIYLNILGFTTILTLLGELIFPIIYAFSKLLTDLLPRFTYIQNSWRLVNLILTIFISISWIYSCFSFVMNLSPVSYCPSQIRKIFKLLIACKSRDSSVGIALGYGPDDRGSRVRFPAGLRIFLFTTASRTALRPTQLPI